MRKFLTFILLFLVGLFVIDRIVFYGLEFMKEQSGFRYSRFLDTESDVIVIGNSRGVHSFNEKYWNSTSGAQGINLSYNGMRPLVLNSILKDISNEDPTAKVYVELTSFFTWTEKRDEPCNNSLNSSPIEEIPDTFMPYTSNFPTLDSLYSNKHLFKGVLRSLDYNSELLPRIFYYLSKSDHDWINTRTISPDLIDYYSDIGCIEFRFDQENFQQLVRISKKLDIKIFIAPWHPNYVEKFSNYESTLNYIRENFEVDIIDMNDRKYESEDFSDGYHMNIPGSRKSTDLLKKTHSLTNPRNN